MKKYKLYKSGKALVTGVLVVGVMLLSGISQASADTNVIGNTNQPVQTQPNADKANFDSQNSAKPQQSVQNSSNQTNTDTAVGENTEKETSNSAKTVINQPATDDTSGKTSNKSTTSDTNQPAINVTSDKVSNNSATSNNNQSTTNVTSDKASNNSATSNNNQPVTNSSVSNEKIPDTEPVKNGWVLNNGTNYYYENGNLVTGEKKIDNYWYNFDKSGQYSTGLTNLTYKTVFYDNNGHMYYGYLRTDNTYMYFDTRDGHAVTGERYYGNHQMEYYAQDFKQVRNNYVRTGNTYYLIGQYGDALTGERYYGNHQMEYYGQNFKQVRNNYVRTGNTYYFIGQYGDAVTGERYYGNHQMEYYGQDFKQVRNNYVTTGNTYYFIGQFGDALTGFRYYGSQPNQVEYYGTNFKQLRNMSITLNGRNYNFGANGDLIIANQPTYFSQLDGRWSSHRFNDYTMGQAGCVPTSIAMVLNGSYGIRVSPDDVRNVMNNISVSSFGATGQDLINAVRYYGRQVNIVDTVERTAQVLQQGVPVIEFVSVGGGITHAIALYGYSNGATQVFDPYNRAYFNGWYNVNYLASRISSDGGDWNAGRPVFAIM
ncbi:KxYKxGKxW signal peptide domain-containing protein [Leuconostoc citreum]